MAWSNEQRAPGHKAWARAVLRRAGGACEIRSIVCMGRADVADHVVPIAEGGEELDLANGQAACKACHDRKTAVETHRGRRRHYTSTKHPREAHPGSV